MNGLIVLEWGSKMQLKLRSPSRNFANFAHFA